MGFSNFFTFLIGSPLHGASKVWREIKNFEVRGIFNPLFLGEFVKEGSPYWVDRICSFGPKLHNLQRINDSITSRILELQLSF